MARALTGVCVVEVVDAIAVAEESVEVSTVLRSSSSGTFSRRVSFSAR